MKVYAEYFKESDGKEYRRTTLLHFGDSTNLIGSAVLMNPGSAKPVGEPNLEFLKSFFVANHHIDNLNTNNWKSFGDDSTMRQLKKIFNGWYLGKELELNGVIQLFNCFYYRDPNLGKALENYDVESKYNFNEYQLLLEKPVYFGWGWAGKFGDLKQIATEIFSKYDLKKTPIYDEIFKNNCFYHPGYVNRSFKRNAKTEKILKDFYNLLKE